MPLTTLLLGYGVIITTFLTVVAVRSEYYRQLYQNVLWDNQSLERTRLFFQKIKPLLKLMYPIVDKLNKGRGRPATDRRFQLRFLFWWKFFTPGPQQTAVNRLNGSQQLQKLLEAPVEPYTRSSLRRFLKDLGEAGLIEMMGKIVTILLKKGILDISRIVLDSFPIYSYLNMIKCLKMPRFDPTVARRFYQELSLASIVKLFPKQHRRSAPLEDKLKVWIHHHLWDIPSAAINHKFVFGKNNRQSFMILTKGWTSVRTYQNFIKILKSLPNAAEIETATVTEVGRVLHLLEVPLKFKDFQQIEDLSRVFYTPHRLKDRNITLNYCAAKDHHFMGRGGLLAIFPSFELPFFVQITSRYKQTEKGIVAFLQSLKLHHGKKLQSVEVLADSEFGTPEVRNQLTNSFNAASYIPNYGRSTDKIKLSSEQKTRRKTIERIIGRLETVFSLEHPPFLGTELVSLHTHLCVLCDLLLVSFNVFSGNRAHPHSLRGIRG